MTHFCDKERIVSFTPDQSWNHSNFWIDWLNQTLIRQGQGLHVDASQWTINGRTEIKHGGLRSMPNPATILQLKVWQNCLTTPGC